jgi:hypothetical protein
MTLDNYLEYSILYFWRCMKIFLPNKPMYMATSGSSSLWRTRDEVVYMEYTLPIIYSLAIYSQPDSEGQQNS